MASSTDWKPNIVAKAWLQITSRPSGVLMKLPERSSSKKARKRASLARRAVSSRRRPVTSRELTTTATWPVSHGSIRPSDSSSRHDPSRCRTRNPTDCATPGFAPARRSATATARRSPSWMNSNALRPIRSAAS